MTVRHANVNLTLDFGEAKGGYYLVREFDDGETLADILARRGRLQPMAAARLFALALLGLHALHEKHVPAGPLGADSLLLSVVGKSAGSKARTVKILNAGVPRSQFDPAALDTAITAAALKDDSALAEPCEPREELFRLGITFYRSLTGQLPFPPESAAAGGRRATAIRQLTPEVPELLAQLVESMIDADAAQRPARCRAGRQEPARLPGQRGRNPPSSPEEQLVRQPAAPVSVPAPEETANADAASESAEADQPTEGGEWNPQLKTLWAELRPRSAIGCSSALGRRRSFWWSSS